jgi:hypothetical protein
MGGWNLIQASGTISAFAPTSMVWSNPHGYKFPCVIICIFVFLVITILRFHAHIILGPISAFHLEMTGPQFFVLARVVGSDGAFAKVRVQIGEI